MLLKKKKFKKVYSEVTKRGRKETVHKQVIIWLYFRLKLKIFSFALETFSVIFCIQKEILVCRLFLSNENSSYYENNPQYSYKFHKCFKFTYRSRLNT